MGIVNQLRASRCTLSEIPLFPNFTDITVCFNNNLLCNVPHYVCECECVCMLLTSMYTRSCMGLSLGEQIVSRISRSLERLSTLV